MSKPSILSHEINFDNLPVISNSQEKILKILDILSKHPLSHISKPDKEKLFRYIENIDNNVPKDTMFPSLVLPESLGSIIAWCAIFHITKCIPPKSLATLVIFVKKYAENISGLSLNWKGSLTKCIMAYNNGDKYIIDDRETYDLNLLRSMASKSNLFITSNQYDKVHHEAAGTIQKTFRLKQLWQRFILDPTIYKEFSNDKLGCIMFGRHVAKFITSYNTYYGKYSSLNYIDGSKVDDSLYHRSDSYNYSQVFNMLSGFGENIFPSIAGNCQRQ